MRNLALMWVLAGMAVALLAAGDGKPSVSTFTDKRDGKVYKIVKIGRQVWFAENLNYAAKGSKCYKNSADSCAKYGRLYDWNTAMTACPAGTHLPTDEEWTTLVYYVGGRETAGKKLKSTSGWNTHKGGSGSGTDSYDFLALPGGYGNDSGSFHGTSRDGCWWSATESDAWRAWNRNMDYNFDNVGRYNYGKTFLFSVRCVVDNEKEARK
jgi:uncharacterized protein (TIGR02145 family)